MHLSNTVPREFAEPLLRVAADLWPIGSRLIWRPETGSTNADATALADAGAAEGCVVLADKQTAGRGRLGRSWASPEGTGIYASVLFRPPIAVARLLSLASGVAIAEGIEAITGLAPALKWPNDVYLGDCDGQSGRKVAGILAEGGFSRGETWLVVGFGINVLPVSFPPAIAARATSLEAELGRPVDRGELLASCLARLAARYSDLRADGRGEVIDAWRRRAAMTFGRAVEWDDGPAVHSGILENIDDEGGLIVKTSTGVARVVSGEIRWV